MNILYVYAHPNPSSFNSVLKNIALDLLVNLKAQTKVSDLYEEKFNPVASFKDFNLQNIKPQSQYFLLQYEAFKENKLAQDITHQIEKINWANHIIFQFPIWWFSMPAILKGWFDRVWVKGFAYDSGKVFKDGLLKNKSASLIVSTQSPESAYQTDGLQGATFDSILLPIHQILRFSGVEIINPFITFGAFNLDEKQENTIKNNFQIYLQNLVRGLNE